MDEDLMREAEEMGINASMYYFIPARRREALLRKDIDRARARKQEQSATDDE